jgi:hypothetical protein
MQYTVPLIKDLKERGVELIRITEPSELTDIPFKAIDQIT